MFIIENVQSKVSRSHHTTAISRKIEKENVAIQRFGSSSQHLWIVLLGLELKRSHFVKYVCHEVLDVRLDYILCGCPFYAPVCRWSAVTAGRSCVFQATQSPARLGSGCLS